MRQLFTVLCLFTAATVTSQEVAEGNSFRLDIDDEATEQINQMVQVIKEDPERVGRLLLTLIRCKGFGRRECLVEFEEIVLPLNRACMMLFERLPEKVREGLRVELEALAERALKRLGEEEVVFRFYGTKFAEKVAGRLAEAAVERGDGYSALYYLSLIKRPNKLLFATAKALCGDTRFLLRIFPSIPPNKRPLFLGFSPPKPMMSKPLTVPDLLNIQNAVDVKDITWQLSRYGFLFVDAFVEPKPAFADGLLWFALPSGWVAFDPVSGKEAYSIGFGDAEFGYLRPASVADTDGRFVVGLHSLKRPFVSCLDAKRRKLLWVSRLRADVSDLEAVSPPIVALGRVFWLGVKTFKKKKRASLWMVCQDVYGNLLWRRRLGSERWGRVIPRRIFVWGLRRKGREAAESGWRAPGWVRICGPYLLFVSGNGLAGCLEVATGRTIWFMLYPVLDRGRRARSPLLWMPPKRTCQAPLIVKRHYKGEERGWFVFAPGDSDVLVGVRLDGRRWWWRKTETWRVVERLSDGMLFVAERRVLYSRFEEGEVDTRVRLRLIDPATGRLKFSKRIEKTGQLRGSGVLADDRVGMVLDGVFLILKYDRQGTNLKMERSIGVDADWICIGGKHLLLFKSDHRNTLLRILVVGRY